jgi:hypothetical protein
MIRTSFLVFCTKSSRASNQDIVSSVRLILSKSKGFRGI